MAFWKDKAEQERWYANMREAERREANGEAWDAGRGIWRAKRKTTRKPKQKA